MKSMLSALVLFSFAVIGFNAQAYQSQNHPSKKGYKKITCDSGSSYTVYNDHNFYKNAESKCGEKEGSKFSGYGKKKKSGNSGRSSDSGASCAGIDKSTPGGCAQANSCMQSKSFCQYADGRPSCGCSWSERNNKCQCAIDK